MKDDNQNTKVAKSTASMTALDNVSFKATTVDEVMEFLTPIVKSGCSGADTKEKAFTLMIRAKEMGIGLGAALEHMHIINGKTGSDVHILKSLMLKAGTITWEKTEDYVSLDEYQDSVSTYTHADLLEMHGKNGWATLSPNNKANHATISAKAKEKGMSIYLWTRFNVRTTYSFTRYRTLANGKEVEMKETVSFTWDDAVTAGNHTKDVWKKHPKVMLDHKAFILGARAIAADICMGIYTKEELFDMNGIDYKMNDDETISIIDTEATEVD